jgi:hypothetical protein
MPEKAKMSARDYVRDAQHLPAPLRDFHDQKDVFKTFHGWLGELSEKDKQHGFSRPSWADGQIYVIDGFLRFMAACGWTLQRSRASVNFASLDAAIKARQDEEAKSLREYLDQQREERARV